jgi:general L-amino acid transport system permease protein
MSDATFPMAAGNPNAFLRMEASPALPPPALTRGPVAWIRNNLFPSPISSVLTILSVALLIWIVPDILKFLLFDAVWTSDTGEACRAHPDGACWSFVTHKFDYFRYGSYPVSEHWRVDLTEIIGGVLIVWLLWRRLPKKNIAAGLFFVAYPILGFFLLRGAPWLGLPIVDTGLWGGILITLLMSLIGIVFSLPLGVLLALGRRSRLPVIKSASTIFIEVVRGVPFITVLFMANVMLPMFLPDDWSPDRLLRPMVGTALFSAAYMAEVVRGGMQAMPKGQFEGAMAVGLGYWSTMRLIILPQALTLVIPGIVSTFIGLFMDTTLVAIVGIFDFLKTIEAARIDPVWGAPTTSSTGYVFAAIIFWACCFGMSRYSLSVEKRLKKGHKR